MSFRNILTFILLFFIFGFLKQPALAQQLQSNTYNRWVDSVFARLTPDERISQLLMVRAYSNRDTNYVKDLAAQVSEMDLGGICFFQGGPVRQAIVTNLVQQAASTPLLVAIDAEWGLSMRLDSMELFPKQMTLGAIHDNALIYDMGIEVARQLKEIGVHINFAPVADINNNPSNPVINARSFGENREQVAEKSFWYMKGLQDQGLISVAKHFPGHGDTGNDSHYTLPVINKSRQSMDSLEFFPFRYLIERGLKGVMVAHLRVPALDTAARSITSLSKPVITDILRNEMGFKGMVITDGMDMKGLTDFTDPGLVETAALLAGNDILLLPVDARRALNNIRTAIDSGLISQQLIDEKCRRVLQWKFEAGLWNYAPVKTENLMARLDGPQARLIALRSNSEAITLLQDPNNSLPLHGLDTLRIASVVIGDTNLTAFQRRLGDYAPVTHFNLSKQPEKAERDSIMALLQPFNLVIAGFVKTSDLPRKNFGISEQGSYFIDSLTTTHKTMLCLFASPYSLKSFYRTDLMEAILVSFQDNELMQDLTAQAIFGALSIDGRLPVTISAQWPAGSGLSREAVGRVKFTLPEDDGLNSNNLTLIDTIVNNAISDHVFPGAQVVVLRHGKVIYRKAFGHHTYNSFRPVTDSDVFDLASLTKMLGTTLWAMKLTGDGIINPDLPLSDYYEPLQNSNKRDLTIRAIMAHHARLQPYIPYYKGMIKNGNLDRDVFARHYSVDYPYRVADMLYIREDWPDRIIDSIIASPLRKTLEYKYSDLGFMLLARAFEQLTEKPISVELQEVFYTKLGLPTMGYNPRDRFSVDRIVPTENDTIFRKQLILGDVHDPTAAMLGGRAGHAGLFADALDVAVVMQMLLNQGVYGGDTLLDSAIINDFTSTQFAWNNNRRGLGFDKPAPAGQPSPACESASPQSFGHSGFTGTYAWADPGEDLVYVFLSNRVCPDANNNKITEQNIRTRIHQVIYDAIAKGIK